MNLINLRRSNSCTIDVFKGGVYSANEVFKIWMMQWKFISEVKKWLLYIYVRIRCVEFGVHMFTLEGVKFH